ncbi:MAG TPA: flagellar protein FlaG [Chloroflexota bacterium]|nr:flagellar protein FlaG [Chloroflexota bacterium]
MERWLTEPVGRLAPVVAPRLSPPPAPADREEATAAERRPAHDPQPAAAAAVAHETYARYLVHPSGLVRVQIIDARTNQVIREIPPEQVVRIAEELQAYLRARQAARQDTGGNHV